MKIISCLILFIVSCNLPILYLRAENGTAETTTTTTTAEIQTKTTAASASQSTEKGKPHQHEVAEDDDANTNSSVPAGRSLKMVPKMTDLRDKEFPLVTEIPWAKVNISVVEHDDRNPEGFIPIACYRELTGFPLEQLRNKIFRFVIQQELAGKRKLCMLRFPTGVRLEYRFEFKEPNTYVFFGFGHYANLTVATSREISNTERDNFPFHWWKGTIFLPCRYSTLIFHPYREGELFEFRILDNPYQYLDKCSKLVAQYY